MDTARLDEQLTRGEMGTQLAALVGRQSVLTTQLHRAVGLQHQAVTTKLQGQFDQLFAGQRELYAKLTSAADVLRVLAVEDHHAERTHTLVRRIHLRLRARYGRRATSLLVAVKGAPIRKADELVATLAGSRAEIRRALDELDDDAHPGVRMALQLALDALDELHALEVACTIGQENTGFSERHGSRIPHAPPRLAKCTHHRRHLAAAATTSDDPAPVRTPGAMSLRIPFLLGGIH